MADVEVKEFGKYIVADPRICHGKLTFRGTRVMVSIVLDQVSRRMSWETIVGEWRGTVPMEAIEEAVLLARDALIAAHEPWRAQSMAELSVAG